MCFELFGDLTESDGMVHVTDSTFDNVVLKSELPVVVDFYADWCGPCHIIEPVIERLSNEYKGRVVFAKLDTDDNQQIVERYDIMSIPTVMVFRNGKVKQSIIGAVPEPYIRRMIDSVLKA